MRDENDDYAHGFRPCFSLLFVVGAISDAGVAKDFKVVTDGPLMQAHWNPLLSSCASLGRAQRQEKAIAAVRVSRHFSIAYPTETAPQSIGPLKVINATDGACAVGSTRC